LKITLLLLLLTPFDFLLLCLCLLRHCSLCETCDYTWAYSKWCDSSSHYSSIPSQGPIIVLYHLNLFSIIWPGEISSNIFRHV
jgi:hypothetical protein